MGFALGWPGGDAPAGKAPALELFAWLPVGVNSIMMNCTIKKRKENQKENQAGHSSERTVEGHSGCRLQQTRP